MNSDASARAQSLVFAAIFAYAAYRVVKGMRRLRSSKRVSSKRRRSSSRRVQKLSSGRLRRAKATTVRMRMHRRGKSGRLRLRAADWVEEQKKLMQLERK
jgi:hypothetical protein